jgi:glutamate racemase
VLSELRALRPDAALRYLADAAHAPYGERCDAEVIARSRKLSSLLIAGGAEAIVIACNTATAIAVHLLRQAWPETPFIGVEPGVKPALASTRNGRIGVMATRATLRSERFMQLCARLSSERLLHLRACDGLAAAIESGRLDDPSLLALIESHCAPLRDAGVDTVVLGCTHYAFARRHIQAALGHDVVVIDTAAAVARHAANTVRRVAGLEMPQMRPGGRILLQTTGDSAHLQRIANAWLGGEQKATCIGA